MVRYSTIEICFQYTMHLFLFINGIVRGKTSPWSLLHLVFCSLTAITYVLLPMPLLFFAGSDDSMFSESDNR